MKKMSKGTVVQAGSKQGIRSDTRKDAASMTWNKGSGGVKQAGTTNAGIRSDTKRTFDNDPEGKRASKELPQQKKIHIG